MVKIGTWNLERPKKNSWKKVPAQLSQLADVDADIWILTETRPDYKPSNAHLHSACSPSDPERLTGEECWTAIWSKWPLDEIKDPASHKRGSVAAIVETPYGKLIVYGTVLAWHAERINDKGEEVRNWQVHMDEVRRQGSEWVQIREKYPDLPMVVAGDFNQSRDGSRWYGTKAVREELSKKLDLANLRLVTEDDAVKKRWLKDQHLVDHIGLSSDVSLVGDPLCRERINEDGVRMSDHPLIAVNITVEKNGAS